MLEGVLDGREAVGHLHLVRPRQHRPAGRGHHLRPEEGEVVLRPVVRHQADGAAQVAEEGGEGGQGVAGEALLIFQVVVVQT